MVVKYPRSRHEIVSLTNMTQELKLQLEINIHASILVLRWIQTGNRLKLENLKSVLLIAMMIAQKVTDDAPLANLEFCEIWRHCSNESEVLTISLVNKLEVSFLQSVDYRVFVSTQTMIEIYCEIMDLEYETADADADADADTDASGDASGF